MRHTQRASHLYLWVLLPPGAARLQGQSSRLSHPRVPASHSPGLSERGQLSLCLVKLERKEAQRVPRPGGLKSRGGQGRGTSRASEEVRERFQQTWHTAGAW